MIFQVDNSGAIDLSNNWSMSGRTRHMDTRLYFLRELKETGIIKTSWVASDENLADLFTKNLPRPASNKYTSELCGSGEYYKSNSEVRESVRE